MDERIHIMAVGAHAGDVEIAMGAAILAHTTQGHKATIVHLTLGAKGHQTLTEEQYSVQKKIEAENAAKKLKADLRIFPYLDGELVANEESIFKLADLIREIKPTHILTHWPGSIHKDHAAAYHIVKDAIFYAALPSIKREYPAHEVIGPLCGENWEDSINYAPQIFLDVTSVYSQWIDAVKSYELFAGSVCSFNYLRYYDALATQRGVMANYEKAVTFSSDQPLTLYTNSFTSSVKMFTTRSPLFKPELKQNTVG
jgi:LmbE family N-acetylglucosaminyl deacetylase